MLLCKLCCYGCGVAEFVANICGGATVTVTAPRASYGFMCFTVLHSTIANQSYQCMSMTAAPHSGYHEAARTRAQPPRAAHAHTAMPRCRLVHLQHGTGPFGTSRGCGGCTASGDRGSGTQALGRRRLHDQDREIVSAQRSLTSAFATASAYQQHRCDSLRASNRVQHRASMHASIGVIQHA